MKNLFDTKITFLSLIKLTLPTVIMMIFFSLYTIIDGIFVSNLVSSNALSSINIVFPIINLLIGIGVMFATGGSAIVAKTMGEGNNKKARENFSIITLSALICSLIIAVISILFIKNIILALGSTEVLYNDCYSYLLIMLIFTPCIILKMYFDYFLITAGVAKLGLISSVVGGIINVVLDYIFMAKFNMGVSGAAIATCLGYAIPSLVGILYFFNKNNLLHFVKPKFDFKVIKDSCINGSSEMVTQLSSAITTFVYNIVMINLLGEDGVAAITIILYIQFLLCSVYLGFTSGASPCISYNYGAKNNNQLRCLVKNSFLIVFLFSIASFLISRLSSEFLISAFTSKGSDVFNISLNGFNIFSFSFLLTGFNIFITGMFTAFSNGKISAMLSLMRTLILFIIGIILLPNLVGINGVWLVVPFSEIITILLGAFYVYKYKEKYMYKKQLVLN